jgi:hypothetical protein
MKYLLILFVPSFVFASEIINTDGKWIESGRGAGGVKGYVLVEPSPAFIERNRISTIELKAKEEEQRSKKTPEQIMIEDLIKRVEILEKK